MTPVSSLDRLRGKSPGEVYRLYIDALMSARTFDDLIPFYCGEPLSELRAKSHKLSSELQEKELRGWKRGESPEIKREITSEEVSGAVAKLQVDEVFENTGRAWRCEVKMALSDGVWRMADYRYCHADEAKVQAFRDAASAREKKVSELGKSKDPNVTEALITALKDPDSYVRRSAAEALGKVGDTRAVEPLIAVLKEDREKMVRRDTAASLARLRDPRAVEPLKAVALNDPDEQVRRSAAIALEALLALSKDKARAVELEQSCNDNDMASCSDLGFLLQTGRGVAKDADRAAFWFRRACDGGNLNGCFNLASTTKDDARVAELYTKACDGGFRDACRNLGDMYEYGRGVAKNNGRAAALYKKVCDDGDMSGCIALGDMHAVGKGVAKDSNRAAALYKNACEAGATYACTFSPGKNRGDGTSARMLIVLRSSTGETASTMQLSIGSPRK